MYKVSKRMEIAGSHQLNLPYHSPCNNIHGHNWVVTVHCKSNVLDESGLVMDFALVKKIIHGQLDHRHINSVIKENPTAENIARWILNEVNEHLGDKDRCCYRVDVQESEGNIASYIEGEE